MTPRIPIGPDRLADFCRRWKTAGFARLGCVFRDDVGPASDVDALVTFETSDQWSRLDVVEMKLELEAWLGRPVEVVGKRTISNPFRRHRTLSIGRVLDAARIAA